MDNRTRVVINAAEKAFDYIELLYNGRYWTITAESEDYTIDAECGDVIDLLDAVTDANESGEGAGENGYIDLGEV
jgi:hypothetical protein